MGDESMYDQNDARRTELIIRHHEDSKKIAELEATVASLTAQLKKRDRADREAKKSIRPASAEVVATSMNHNNIAEIVSWNNELVQTIEKLQLAMVEMESRSTERLAELTEAATQLVQENEQLREENATLKERVSDDVLRARQVNRIEMAAERNIIAGRVRNAGLQRLEGVEASLMEAHDDVYHIQRWDALRFPRREVSFVFHYVFTGSFSLNSVEAFVMSVYEQILLSALRKFSGYHVARVGGVEIFLFQSPLTALKFARECHERVMELSWPERARKIPQFSTVVESGYALFRGPRMHTCIYACTPSCEENPQTGRALFFGREMHAAITSALTHSAVGEIVVNDTWAQLLCRDRGHAADIDTPVRGEVGEVRAALGQQWDVLAIQGKPGIAYSILPARLRIRRSMQPHSLGPTPRYPAVEGDKERWVNAVARACRGEDGNPGEQAAAHKHRFAHLMKSEMSTGGDSSEGDHTAQLLEIYALKEEKENVIALYREAERYAAAWEQVTMEAEDRFVIAKRRPLDPSEIAFVCTIDIGGNSLWRSILPRRMSEEDYREVRTSVQSFIHKTAKNYYGFLMNGNNKDIFTYTFREVEHTLAFVSDVYIMVNRTGAKYSHSTQGSGNDVFLLRAGISCGSMSTIYRASDNGILKCTGPVIRLSGTLCDLAQYGESLAMDDVISIYYSKNENLFDQQYNVVKQHGKFLNSADAPAVVHSIVPKPFAYRRTQLMNEKHTQPRYHGVLRSVTAALSPPKQLMPWEHVKQLLKQQLQRMEKHEVSTMCAHDNFEQKRRPSALCNRWMLMTQPSCFLTSQDADSLTVDSVVGKELAFLLCDIIGTTSVARDFPRPLVEVMYAQYNHIVQRIAFDFKGYVAKTNSTTAYVLMFTDPLAALEAATRIHKDLLTAPWPEELKTRESTLFVRDPKTGTVLFNGLRPQVVVHLSQRYGWRFHGNQSNNDAGGEATPSRAASAISVGAGAIDVFGFGLEELFLISAHTRGGEIRLSPILLERVKQLVGGQLLVSQLFTKVIRERWAIPESKSKKSRRNSRRRPSSTTRKRNSHRLFSSTQDLEASSVDSLLLPDESSVSEPTVVMADCIVAVPLLLQARLDGVVAQPSPSQDNDSSDEQKASTTTERQQSAGLPHQERPDTPPNTGVPLKQLTSLQAAWLTSPSPAPSALPVAELPSEDLAKLTTHAGHPEVEHIQRLTKTALDAFPPLHVSKARAADPAKVESGSARLRKLSTEGSSKKHAPARAGGSASKGSTEPSSSDDRDFELFMVFSRELLTLIFNAFKTASENAQLPSRSKSPVELQSRSLASPTDKIIPRPSTLPSIRGGSRGSTLNALSPTHGTVPRTTISSPRALTQSIKKSKAKAPNAYKAALDYLESACRHLTQRSSTPLGKLTTIPAAPSRKI